MADIVVTPANVAPGTDAVTENVTFGATVLQGQTCYIDVTDGKAKLADANLSVAAAATRGIALNSGVNGQPGVLQRSGKINPGGTVVPGVTYIQSGTAGGIAPTADAVAGWNITVLGVGISATQIQLLPPGPFVSGGVV